MSPTWRQAIGALDLDQAEAAVYLKDVRQEVPRPHAIVSVGGNPLAYKLLGGGAENSLNNNGSVALYLAKDVPPEFFADDVGAEIDFASFCGSVLDDVANLSAADDPVSFDGTSHLSIISITTAEFSGNPEANWNSQGRFFFGVFELNWDN